MRKRKIVKKRMIIFIVAALVLVTVISLGIYALTVNANKVLGVALIPSKDYALNDVEVFLQKDPQWASDTIGGTNRTMGSIGCLVSCVAMSINDLGFPTTPGDVNQKLCAIDGYDNADLTWYKINEAFPNIDYKYDRAFSASMIEDDLENGLLPIVNVKYYGLGFTHWVIIVGAKDNEFYVIDPLNEDKTPMPLSTHGKVYSYRVLYATKGSSPTPTPQSETPTPTQTEDRTEMTTITFDNSVQLKSPKIVVKKSERILELWDNEELCATFPIGLGFAPEGHKKEEGDGKTPEGEYYVCVRNDKSRYYLSLGLSYPNKKDAQVGFDTKLIDRGMYDQIASAIDNQSKPPWNTPLGGEIMIHGMGAGRDWTLGCVAVENDVMDILWKQCSLGTRVTILP